MSQSHAQTSACALSIADELLSRRTFVKSAGAVAAGLALPVAATNSAAALTPAGFAIDQDTLVIGDNMAAFWKTLDPGFFYEGNPSAAMYLIYDQLYHIPDPTKPSDITPLLATELPVFSEDGLTATIPLRKGVAFHTTGNEMTAADVIFSWNRLKNIGLSGAYLATEYWSDVQALDDYTLQLTLPAPNPALAAVLTALMLSITDRKAVEAAGGTGAPLSSDDENAPELLANLTAQDAINQSSAGTGPFILAAFDINAEVHLERNPAFRGNPSQLNRVIWRNTVDPNAQLQAVQIGEADIATTVNAEEVTGIESGDELQIVQGASLAFQYLAINLREEWGGPLANPAVRQALAHGVDYQGIIDSLLLGRAIRPATAIPLPLSGAEAMLAEAYQTDLIEAQRLWDESGAVEATIEILYGADATGRGGVNLTTLATKIQSDLEKIDGLTIKLAPVPNAQRSKMARAGEYQIMIASWISDFPGADSFATPFYRTGASVAKRVDYSDPAMDALLDQASAESDPEIQERLYIEVQRLALAACPYIILYQPDDIKIASKAVTGAQVHPIYSMQLRNASKSA